MSIFLIKIRIQKTPYLTNAEENELKRLKNKADEGIIDDEELWLMREV